MDEFFNLLELTTDFYWDNIGVFLILATGMYFTFKGKFYQIRILFNPVRTFKDLVDEAKKNETGQHPIKLYLASVSGMAGIGNIVTVITALTIGGPGSLVWLWITAIFGMIIKYSEIYLGVKYRKKNNTGGYDGGPMYYLQEAYKSPFWKKFFFVTTSALLWIYGVEVYQFAVITDVMTEFLQIDKTYFVPVLAILTLYAGLGGIKRLANICSIIGPIFISVYSCMCLWVIFCNFHMLGNVLLMVFKSAFSGHAAVGGFAGSSLMLATRLGIQRAVYSGDIAIGYDSIIQSETRITTPEKQARIAIFGVFTDSLFCTFSILVVLVTGLWTDTGIKNHVSQALGTIFPYSDVFMVFFIFIAGWTTIIAFLAVGKKAACCLFPKHGKYLFFAYSAFSLIYFAHFDYTKVFIIMNLSGGLLVLCNLLGMLRLRNKIKFRY